MSTAPADDKPNGEKSEHWQGFAVSIVVALAVFVFADVTFRDTRFSRALDAGSWIPSKAKVMRQGQWDVVVAGSSVIAEGLNPKAVTDRYLELTGRTIRVFNFGVSAGGFDSDYLIANRIIALPPELRPKLYIISVSPMEYSCCPQVELPSHAKWGNALALSDLPSLLRAAPTFEEASNDLLLASSRLLAVRAEALTFLFDQQSNFGECHWPADGGGGTVGVVDPGTQDARAQGRVRSFSEMMLKPRHVDRDAPISYLRRMVARLRDAGVRVAMIGSPQAPQLEQLDGDNSIYPDFAVYVRQLAEQLGTGFTDFRQMEGVTAADFGDGDHLNSIGSVKFSRKLAEQVVVPRLP